VLDAQPALRQARMALARAAKNALRATLDTLGIVALETM
jgi:arginyl-tRNA synthetase